jgi:hypothetical protein
MVVEVVVVVVHHQKHVDQMENVLVPPIAVMEKSVEMMVVEVVVVVVHHQMKHVVMEYVFIL